MLLTREEMTLYRGAPQFSIAKDREVILRALSHLFYGEVGAVKIGQWVTKAPDMEGMWEIVKQTRDETRHAGIFRRLLQRYGRCTFRRLGERHGRVARSHQSHVGRDAL